MGSRLPASYTLDVFAVPASITGKQEISLSGDRGCSRELRRPLRPPLRALACSGGDIGATLFTNDGLIDTTSGGGPPLIPEPASFALLSIALAGPPLPSAARETSATKRKCCGVTFRYRDYRCNGQARYRTMTLSADEFISASCSTFYRKGFIASATTGCWPVLAARPTSRTPRS
jgi:hypothetical protein